MKKNKSVIIFIISILVVAACCFVTIFGIDLKGKGSAGNITLGLDLRGGVSITYQVVDEDFSDTDMADTVYKLQLRVAEYSADATAYQEGTDRITVEIPGVYDTETIIEELGNPGTLYFVTETDADGNTNYAYDSTTGDYALNYDIDTLIENGSVVCDGSDVTSAVAQYQTDSSAGTSEPVVSLQFDDSVVDDNGQTATERFAEATEEAYSNSESIAIIYDDEFVSVPSVNSSITNGSCVIEGLDDYEEAQTLASTIRIGSLNLTLEEASSQVVSAKLGSNAVTTSLIAGFIGLALIMIFMIAVYRIPGVAAAITLVFYAAATLLLLNAFNLTLSISGIAGIILSIGMAVDGNVIINVRIKEELQAGKSVDLAIREGFRKSMSAILDGNITTLIVAIVLLIFGSGSIQGFGMTLAIGIVLSVISSLLVSRLFVSCFYGMGIRGKGAYAIISNKERKIFDFIGKKVIWFVIAIVCIVAGVVAMIANSVAGNRALNLSIEFVGGVSVNVDFEDDISIDEFNDSMKNDIAEIIGSTDIEGQKVTGSNEYVIKMPDIEQDVITDLKEMLVSDYGALEDSLEITRITATISSELQRDAFISLAISAVCMLIYIWIRFRRFRFAISSVLALLHDVMIVVAFYAIVRVSVGNSFIACILTIVGYSINATIVTFDRIRENMNNELVNYDLKLVVNSSIQQTLTRSIYTSATTFVMVLILYILGVESMRAFALPLAIGIIAGTFSSIFLAGNLFYIMSPKAARFDEAGARRAKKLLGDAYKSDINPDGSINDAKNKSGEIAGRLKDTAGEANKFTDNSQDAAEIVSGEAESKAGITGSAAIDAENAAIEAKNKIKANPYRKKKKKRKQ